MVMSALALRILACICMLLDHIGYCVNNMTLRYVGRLAFPIYIFLMVNGFHHSRSRLRYALRFGIFALLSQIPFTLMAYGRYDFVHWNVMLTLLISLAVLWLGELLRKAPGGKLLCLLPAVLVYCVCHYGYIDMDYGGKGILLAVIFWLLDGKPLWITFACLFAVMHEHILNCILHFHRGVSLQLPNDWEMTQLLSLFSLPFIFSYNGEVGKLPSSPFGRKLTQLGFYAFYPLHMLLLWLLFVR